MNARAKKPRVDWQTSGTTYLLTNDRHGGYLFGHRYLGDARRALHLRESSATRAPGDVAPKEYAQKKAALAHWAQECSSGCSLVHQNGQAFLALRATN